MLPGEAYTSLTELRNTIIKELNLLKVPTMLVQSLRDRAVRKGSVQYIKEQLSNSRVKMLVLPNSGHIATMEQEKDLLAQELAGFMSKESQ